MRAGLAAGHFALTDPEIEQLKLAEAQLAECEARNAQLAELCLTGGLTDEQLRAAFVRDLIYKDASDRVALGIDIDLGNGMLRPTPFGQEFLRESPEREPPRLYSTAEVVDLLREEDPREAS